MSYTLDGSVGHVHADTNTNCPILFWNSNNWGNPGGQLGVRYWLYDSLFFELFQSLFLLVTNVIGNPPSGLRMVNHLRIYVQCHCMTFELPNTIENFWMCVDNLLYHLIIFFIEGFFEFFLNGG